MLKQSISVKDQFGVKHFIQATVDQHFANTNSNVVPLIRPLNSVL